MAKQHLPSVDSLFAAAENRISCYSLNNSSPIPESRIEEIVRNTVKHAPSSFNVQSARAVILFKDENQALWDIGDRILKETQSEDLYKMAASIASRSKNGYGSVLWFEDQEALDGLANKNPPFKDVVPQWSATSSGMHQYLVWTALELEGLGCNLQHFNFMPEFTEEVKKRYQLPQSWKLMSQLVFGHPGEEGLVRKKERTYQSLDDRVKVVGA